MRRSEFDLRSHLRQEPRLGTEALGKFQFIEPKISRNHAPFCVFTYTYAPFARFFAEKKHTFVYQDKCVLLSTKFAFGE